MIKNKDNENDTWIKLLKNVYYFIILTSIVFVLINLFIGYSKIIDWTLLIFITICHLFTLLQVAIIWKLPTNKTTKHSVRIGYLILILIVVLVTFIDPDTYQNRILFDILGITFGTGLYLLASIIVFGFEFVISVLSRINKDRSELFS